MSNNISFLFRIMNKKDISKMNAMKLYIKINECPQVANQ